MKTECGIFACIINNILDKQIIYNAMANIQHRGQDSYGYITIDNDIENNSARINITKEFGLLCNIDNFMIDNFMIDNHNEYYNRNILFLGHMRYSTNTILENSLNINNVQPIEIYSKNHIYIAHNGNLPNLKDNIMRLQQMGIANGTEMGLEYEEGMSDTKLFKMIWDTKMHEKINNITNDILEDDILENDILEYITYILENIPGAYSCVLSYCSNTKAGKAGKNNELCLFGFRDKMGIKPLSICMINNNYCFVSETVQVLDCNDGAECKFITDVLPGEIWMINQNRINKITIDTIELNNGNGNGNDNSNGNGNDIFFCALEPIYFMKKDSLLFNGMISVSKFRELIGIELAKQDIQQDNINCGDSSGSSDSKGDSKCGNVEILYIPESSYSIACGYSSALGNRSLGNRSYDVRKDLILKVENIRSFIESTHDARIGKLKRKFAFNIEDIKKLREIILIDDSIVRGNSMKFIVDTLKSINPSIIIHIRVGCPKLVKGCQFGIDLYDDELIALQVEDLAEYFGVASIRFLELDRLRTIFSNFGIINCGMCFGNIDEKNMKMLEW